MKDFLSYFKIRDSKENLNLILKDCDKCLVKAVCNKPCDAIYNKSNIVIKQIYDKIKSEFKFMLIGDKKLNPLLEDYFSGDDVVCPICGYKYCKEYTEENEYKDNLIIGVHCNFCNIYYSRIQEYNWNINNWNSYYNWSMYYNSNIINNQKDKYKLDTFKNVFKRFFILRNKVLNI